MLVISGRLGEGCGSGSEQRKGEREFHCHVKRLMMLIAKYTNQPTISRKAASGIPAGQISKLLPVLMHRAVAFMRPVAATALQEYRTGKEAH
ncbi:hypothetical protein [Chitinophaga sp. CB10]|uniref:hypothetical protein n=1 Tax=Chitinophaga sp. CB10 TaxID=1891659 RepID=UPI0025C2CBF9|nr:hypothetical protein [Chitinophaga sp. CB10]